MQEVTQVYTSYQHPKGVPSTFAAEQAALGGASRLQRTHPSGLKFLSALLYGKVGFMLLMHTVSNVKP